MQPQTDEATMLDRALQFYPLLAQRLSEADKAIVLEGITEFRNALKYSQSMATGLICYTLSYPLKAKGTVVGIYVDKHIRPRLSNVSGQE